MNWIARPFEARPHWAGPSTEGPAAPRREGVSTRNKDDFATASSIGAAAGKRNEIRSLVLLGWLNGSRSLRLWFARGDRLYLLQRLCKLRSEILFVLRIYRLREERNLHEEAVQ